MRHPPGVLFKGLLLYGLSRVLNALFDLYTGGERRQVFFEIDEVYPSLSNVTRAHGTIRRELEGVLAEGQRIPSYHEVDPMQYAISAVEAPARRWQVYILETMGIRWEQNCASCPKTAALVGEIPDVFQAFFSILEPGKIVPAHSGIYRGYLRYHLGVITPHERPPRIRVHDQYHTWREGEAVLFDDSWEHEVENSASEPRVILIIDVLRPLPSLPRVVNRLMRRALRLLYVRWVLNVRQDAPTGRAR